MSQELTPSQEDIICEPQKVCDFCKKIFPKDEIVEQKIDNDEIVEICSGCLEELQDNNNCDYKENYGEEIDRVCDSMKDEKAENDFEAGVSERKSEGMF